MEKDKKILATPKVRKFARELGANVSDIQGTERKGRITEYDVKKYITNQLSAESAKLPKKIKRDPSRLFVSFRPNENIKNEISVTNGYEFKLKAPVAAKSGKKSYDLFSKGRFAWVVDNEDETKLIVTMKKASRLMIIGNTNKGDQTTDHYSMMGFTKAYNTAKKSCS